jgi:DNA-binding IclR family transcriptional regulator
VLSKKKEKLTAIEKALEILVTFVDKNRELGTVEVSELTGFHKATTSRILANLLDYGLVSQEDKTKKFKLGPLAYQLGLSQTSKTIQAFVDISKLHIDQLSNKLGETISLEVWTGNNTVACYLAESINTLQVNMTKADLLPLHAPAGAKAILAYVGVEQINRLLNKELERFTENTITSRDELHLRLIEYNKQGYAVDHMELHKNISAVGVPIFDYLNKPVAAICAVISPTSITEKREKTIVMELNKAAKIIAREMNEKRMLYPYQECY